MKNLIVKAIDWLTYPSSWKGIVSVVTAVGVGISPELADKIVAVGLGIVGLIQFFIDDTKADKSA